ncbi:bleomycin resistance protein [Paenibacillus sp. sptzw28]|nr:bleomycin resistance protein [Paenibacillus sp. sptzw28]
MQKDLKGSSTVLLVPDLQQSIDYYEALGFTKEVIGGHTHMQRGQVTFIPHPAKNADDVKPSSSVEGGLYFDVFCYAEGIRTLYEEFQAAGVEIVNGPNWGDSWSEFTIRDINGYRIAFGG